MTDGGGEKQSDPGVHGWSIFLLILHPPIPVGFEIRGGVGGRSRGIYHNNK